MGKPALRLEDGRAFAECLAMGMRLRHQARSSVPRPCREQSLEPRARSSVDPTIFAHGFRWCRIDGPLQPKFPLKSVRVVWPWFLWTANIAHLRVETGVISRSGASRAAGPTRRGDHDSLLPDSQYFWW